jgi:hypothetical protein
MKLLRIKKYVKNGCVKMSSQKSQYKQDRMLPPQVVAVLRIREHTTNQCPEEILRRIESLKIGKVVYSVKGPVGQNSGHNTSNSGWRGSRPINSVGGGFRQQSSSWSRPLTLRRVGSESPREDEHHRYKHSNSQTPTETNSSPTIFPSGGRYVSAIVSEKNVDDRIIGHIRSKLNKFSGNNYDSVKSFLEQIMNSGETEFISEFMDLLFAKAGSEEIYCELYARLLSELTDKFPHLVTEISSIYSNYISIFQEARDIPDQGTADYKKFLEAQLRKKFRYGYSHFLAEIYNKNLLPNDAIEITIKAILDSLNKLEKDVSNTLLVEEYLASLHKIICTINIAKSAPYPPYIDNMVDTLKKIIDKPKENTLGFTTKSRFKIMDIVEALP